MELRTKSRALQRALQALSFFLSASFTIAPFSVLADSVYAPPTSGQPTTFAQNLFSYQSVRPSIDQSTGAFTQKIPLDIPPGRNGLQPDLSLEYNSQNTADSMVGYGWSLSIPYIERLNKSGSERLYADGYFTSSLGGELATTSSSTTYRHKSEDGRFITYSFSNNTWIAYDKEGTRYTFGSGNQARQFATTSTSTVYKWMIEEVRDANDNYVTYSYSKDGNELYPSHIVYTGHGSTDGPFTVNFGTSTRPDPYIKYRGGIKVATNYRISTITASVSGNWVRKYDLSYSSGNNGTRSLLSSIQRTGRDDGGVQLSEPALTFAYSASTTPFVDSNPPPQNVAYVVADVQGNARNDLSVFYHIPSNNTDSISLRPDGGTEQLLSNPPTTWARYSSGDIQFLPTESGVRFLDINGDGKADLIRGSLSGLDVATSSAMYLNAYATSTGYAWSQVASTSWQGQIPPFSYTTLNGYYTVTTGIFGDVNADGIPDYAMASNEVSSAAYLGNGLGWTPTTTIFNAVERMPGVDGTPQTNSQLIDINGDGLDDWVYSNPTIEVRLNTGLGWETSSSTQWAIATSTIYNSSFAGNAVYWDRGMRLLDINGDGLPDFVRAYSMPAYNCSGTGWTCAADIEVGEVKMVLLNTGSGWATTTMSMPSGYITYGQLYPAGVWQGDLREAEWVNWRGNGQQDQDVLKQVNYPRGGNTQIEYIPTALQGTNPELPISLLTVSKITNNDGNGNGEVVTYSYEGGKQYLVGGIREKRFAGFSTITESHPDFVVKSYFHQNDGASNGVGEQTDGYAQIGHVFRQDTMALSTTSPSKRVYYKWDTPSGTSTPAGSTFVYKSRELEQAFGPSGTHRDRGFEYSYSTTTGDLLQEIDYGEVTGGADGTFTDSGSDDLTRNLSYATASTTNLSVPTQESMLDHSGGKVKETKFYYDNLSFGSVSIGNETKQDDWISSTTYASTTRAYNSYGLPTEDRDSRYNPTTYVYDSHVMYPATTTDALGHSTSYYYDYTTGRVREKIDPGGYVWDSVFDPLGRLEEERIPDPSTGASVTKAAYSYSDSTYPNYMHIISYLNDASSTDSYAYFDGLGRIIQERSKATSTYYTVKDTIYSSKGMVYRVSLPYFAAGASSTAATTSAPLWTIHLYDALRRPTEVGTAVGTTSYAYDGWKVTQTDPRGKSRDLLSDAFGNLIQVNEYSGTSTYSTFYEYNRLKNLTKITDALGNVRDFTYDGLGRRLTSQDLHAPADATYGTWTYSYDDSGNLVQKVDPKGQTISYTFDALNRPLTEDFTGQSGVEAQYAYDSCVNGALRLCVATSSGAISSYSYNAVGQIASEIKQIDSSAFVTAYTYDRLGNTSSVTYPNSAIAQYWYGPMGRLQRVAFQKPGGAFVNAITNIDYGPGGQETYKLLGNGTITLNTYDPAQLYRLTNILTKVPILGGGGAVQGVLGLAAHSFIGNIASGLEKLPLAILGDLDPVDIVTSVDAVSSLSLASNTESASSTLLQVTSESVTLSTSTEMSSSPTISSASTTASTDAQANVDSAASSTPPEAVSDAVATSTSYQVTSVDTDTASSTHQETMGHTGTSTEPVVNQSDLRVAPSGELHRMLTGKSAKERADLKGHEIAGLRSVDRVREGKYEIEVVSMQSIDGGVEVFARAWNDQGQIGFGTDGTVDMERFRIFNPPILVPDENGNIVRQWEETNPATGSKTLHRHTLREDAKEALLQIIAQNIAVMKNVHSGERVIKGKQGRTTDTYFSAAGGDGMVERISGSEPSTGGETWSTIVGGSGTGVSYDNTQASVRAYTLNLTDKWYILARLIFQFDTSALPDTDVISSATLGLYNNYTGDTDGEYGNGFNVYGATPGSTASLSSSDFSQTGATAYSAGFSFSSIVPSQFNNIAFNATGISNISKTGYTKLSVKIVDDVTGTTPSWSYHAGHNQEIQYRMADQTGTTYDPRLVVEHHVPNDAPSAPTDLQVNGFIDPTNLANPVPEFSAIYNDPDSADAAASYQIQVATSSVFDSSTWDSSKTTLASSTAQGTRIAAVPYAGTGLASSTTYYWRIRFWDIQDATSTWSTATSTFSLAADAPSNAVQYVSFTYDADGNITSITDISNSDTNKSVAFEYDDLNRLITASSTSASTTPYREEYSYDAIGNLLSKSGIGSYSYAGTNYANPHAPTTIGATSYSYDSNGNLASAGSTNYSWDYLNRLTQVSTSTGTGYAYDHTMNRVRQIVGTATTTYANKYYSVSGATTTAYIFGGDGLVAYVEGEGSATSTRYVLKDYLGSTNIVTDATGTAVQVLDYYPYGSTRINSSTGGADTQKKFVGMERDSGTGLDYANARYYEANRGQFLSEDPVFWEIGQTPDGRAALSNPQSMNSYAYAGGNPITNKDPNGRFWWVGFYDWSGYEGMKGVGMKALEVMGGHDRAMSAMQANQGAVNSASAKYGVNPALANAVMYEEQSHLLNLPGIPFESTKDYLFPNSQLGGYDGGVGVMQVTGGVGQQYGYNKTELARDPRKNIDAGVGNLGKVQSGSTAMTASRYNNGTTQSVTNYGQRVAAQVNNPNYNTNVLVYGLQQIVSGLQSIISSLKK